MFATLSNTLHNFTSAVKNPFGLDFEIHDNNLYIPVGSALNCLGYNDYLERVIGVARICLGVIALAFSNDRKERLIAAGHILRGYLEMKGSYEKELLILDTIFTIYNIMYRSFGWGKQATDKALPDDVID